MKKAPFFLLVILTTIFGIFSCSDDEITDTTFRAERVRKNAKDLTSQEKTDYVNAILALKHTPSPYSDTLSYYDQFVIFHQISVERTLCTGIHVAHANPAFPAWHRKLLVLYEDALSEVSGKTIALPYWDWTDTESTDATFSDDLMGDEGDPNDEYAVTNGPFKKGSWTINVFTIRPDFKLLNPHPWLVRKFGATIPNSNYPGYPVNLPTQAEIGGCLAIETYDRAPWDCTNNGGGNNSFRFCLEGFLDGTCSGGQAMHNIGHDWIAGFFEIPVDRIEMIPVESTIPFCGKTMRDTVPNNVRTGSMEPLDVSPNDPAFFMHHCNVDRLWNQWQELPGNETKYEPVSGAPEGYNLRDEMFPYTKYRGVGMDNHGLTPESMLRIEDLQYRYE